MLLPLKPSAFTGSTVEKHSAHSCHVIINAFGHGSISVIPDFSMYFKLTEALQKSLASRLLAFKQLAFFRGFFAVIIFRGFDVQMACIFMLKKSRFSWTISPVASCLFTTMSSREISFPGPMSYAFQTRRPFCM